MKRYMVLFLLIFVISVPSRALVPEFGVKLGIDNQKFENLELLNDYNYNDSLSKIWPSVGAFVKVDIPLLPFALRGEANYGWSAVGDSTATDLNIVVSGMFSVSPPLSPLGFYLGAGPSLHILRLESQSENIYGAQVYGGLDIKMGLDIFVEGGYAMMFPGEGSWNQFNAKLGMYF